MVRFGLLFLVGICSTSFLNAQMNPVEWTFTLQKGEETAYKVVCTAELDAGWYIYSQFLGDEGPIPTSITLEDTDAFVPVGEPTEEGDKKEGHDPIFDMHIVKFSQTATFSQPIKITADNATIRGSVEYMTCDDHKCLPPTTKEFALRISN